MLSDRFGARAFATGWLPPFAVSFVGLIFLPVNFSYWVFALLITVNGLGVGMFSAPNSASIMSSVPASQRGAASGMRSTFQNTGTALSIGVFFSLMIAGLSRTLPETLQRGLEAHGVPHDAGAPPGRPAPGLVAVRRRVRREPDQAPAGAERRSSISLPETARETLTGRTFFPELLAAPFHDDLVVSCPR